MLRPRVTLKLATSLDGRIATAYGESKWITGEAARAEVQKLRASHDVVMIGAETARRDDPWLIARTEPPPPKQPARVVVTSGFDIPHDGKLFANIADSPLIIFGADQAKPHLQDMLTSAGARIEQTRSEKNGVDITAVLARLSELGFASVLTEGGGKLAAALFTANAIDRIEWFRAPIVLGAGGRPAVGTLGFSELVTAPRFKRVALRELGPDIWESYERA